MATGPSSFLRVQAAPQRSLSGHAVPQLCAIALALRTTSAAPRTLPLRSMRMKRGMTIPAGQAVIQGAS